MKKEELILREKTTKLYVKHELFFQWICNLIDVNSKLLVQYDVIYQRSYYTLVVELLNEGKKYIEECLLNGNDREMYLAIGSCITKMRSSLSNDEFLFLVYKRDSACHIFQDCYDIIRPGGVVKSNKKIKAGLDVFELQQMQDRVLKIHRTDKNFGKHIVRILSPTISELDHLLFP